MDDYQAKPSILSGVIFISAVFIVALGVQIYNNKSTKQIFMQFALNLVDDFGDGENERNEEPIIALVDLYERL